MSNTFTACTFEFLLLNSTQQAVYISAIQPEVNIPPGVREDMLEVCKILKYKFLYNRK